MKLSLKWLQEYISEDLDAEQLSRDLTMLGIEVESITRLSPSLENIVVARIDSILRHPNADKLSVCKVFDGEEIRNIVCGASNIKEGDIVPLAKTGAVLSSGIKLKKTKIRGEVSEGMMCSEQELGLGTDKSGILILSKDTPAGKPLKDLFNFDDVIIEVSVTPNRGDLLSVKGIAREVCSLKKIPFEKISFLKGVNIAKDDKLGSLLSVCVEEEKGCPLYGYGIAEDVSIGLSPLWMRYRLTNCGVRPINNIVDITNYIMLELGHPMHAFDLEALEGKKIVVRKSKKGEKIKALDGSMHTLDDTHLVIADENKPVAVAGVMGGENTEVTEKTRHVVFECAYFDPGTVRRTSKALGLFSESSYRFERGVDISDISDALLRAYELVEQNIEGKHKYSEAFSKGSSALEKKSVSFRSRRCNKILGTDIKTDVMEDILKNLGFKCEGRLDAESKWSVPSHRFMDIEREIDLIEEVARVYGYTHIPEHHETLRTGRMPEPGSESNKKKISQIMPNLGFHEVTTYCLVSSKEAEHFAVGDQKALALKNPISEDLKYLRTSLVPTLCKVIATNSNYGYQDIKIFETGKTYYSRGKDHPAEKTYLAFALCGIKESRNPFEKKRPYDFYDLKGSAESLGDALGGDFDFVQEESASFMQKEALSIMKGDLRIGMLGAVNRDLLKRMYDIEKEVFYGEMVIDDRDNICSQETRFKALNRFPSVFNDISFIVDVNVSHKDIYETILELKIKELENIQIYDIFEGRSIPDGKKSMTYMLHFRSEKRTLTSDEVSVKVSGIVKALEKKFNIHLRTK